MPFLGVIYLGLCAMQVISFPLTSPASEDDSKVMKCIVEVISDTLSKPSPIPISQNCLETLRGDERIISILRHQNLLKELQELATQGATERLQKKAASFEDELSGVLERQNNKPVLSDKSEGIPPGSHESSFGEPSSESTGSKRKPEEDEKAGYQREHSREDNSAEELESNDIEKREEAPEGDETDNHITDNINDADLPRETEDNTSHNSREQEAESQKESSEADEKRIEGKENPEQSSETEEEDDTQRDDNSQKFSQDHESDKREVDAEAESSKEERKPEVETTQEGGNSHHQETKSDEETTSNELEDSKRFNKMDELAKQLTSKKWVEENSSEEAPHQSAERKYDAASEETDSRQQWKQSRDDGNEKESQIAKRPDQEERKEEEGSANRKTEDQELESLAAIEAELESVAHKLHELRRV